MKYIFIAVMLLACAAHAGVKFISSGGFPAGTLITATSGDFLIEELKKGDKILAFSDDNLVQSEVRDTYDKKTMLFTIQTNYGKLVTTRYHLLLTWKGFAEAQSFKAGDEVAYLKNGRRVWARIKSVKSGKTGTVYNLQTGPPHTFIANGFLVHN